MVGQVVGSREVCLLLDGLRSNDQSNDWDNNCKAQNLNDAVDQNGQQKNPCASAFAFGQQRKNASECLGKGISLVQNEAKSSDSVTERYSSTDLDATILKRVPEEFLTNHPGRDG